MAQLGRLSAVRPVTAQVLIEPPPASSVGSVLTPLYLKALLGAVVVGGLCLAEAGICEDSDSEDGYTPPVGMGASQ